MANKKKPSLPKLTMAEFRADQERVFDALQLLDAHLLLQDVPTHMATGGFRNSLPRFLLHQTYEVSHPGDPFREMVHGMEDSLRWGLEHINFAPHDMLAGMDTYPFLDRAALLRALYEEHELSTPSPSEFRFITFSYSTGSRPDARFFVCGFFIGKETRWVITMLRHGQLRDEPLDGNETQLCKELDIKDEQVRRASYDEAKLAIARCAQMFMKGYKPFND